MKKLLVKIKIIDKLYKAPVFDENGVEIESEQPEVSHEEIIAQTQGTDEELAQWLAGDAFKYPEGYWVEYVDISAQVEQERINAESLKYLADTDWMQIRFTETGIEMPPEVKLTRQQMRERIIR